MLMFLFMFTACVVTTETNVPCWKQRICVGDTYEYRKAPDNRGGYYVTDVQILVIKGNQCQIRHRNGREQWVNLSYFEDNSKPKHVHRQPNKKEKKEHKRKY